MNGVPTRFTLALAVGAACAWLVGACGSGNGAEQARQAVAQHTATSQTGASTKEQTTRTGATIADTTNTDPGKTTTTDTATTKTVTEPGQTRTVTTATTETAPAKTATQTVTGNTTQTVQSNTNKVLVSPTSTTHSGETGSGVPWWGWVLIALGAVGIGIGIFWVGHRHGRSAKRGGPRSPDEPQTGADPPPPVHPPPRV